MKKTSLLKSGLWITLGTFTKRFFALLSNLILARLLVPADFGIISIAYIFWSFINLFTQSSTGLFILYKGTDDKRYLNTTYTIGLIIGLFFALLLGATAPLIANFFNEPNLSGLLVVYAFNLSLSSVFYVYEAIMIRQMQHQQVAQTVFIGSITRLIFTASAALLGLRYWSFAIGDAAYWLVSYILVRFWSGHNLRLQIVPEVRSEVVSYGLGSVGTSFGFYVNLNLDNFVVGKLLSSTSLGYYNLAYQLTMSLSSVINQVMERLGTPAFANLTDDQQQEEALFKVVEQMAFFAAPLYSLLFLILDKQTITLAFGSKWAPAATVIPWLLVCAYFRVLNNPLKSMMSAKGLPNINARVNLCIAPLAVLSFIIGAQQRGIVGVGMAVAVVLGVVWTLYWWWTACRVLNWSITKFMVPCLRPMIIAFTALIISFQLIIVIKQIAFVLLYITGVRLIAPQQFDNYCLLLNKVKKRIFNKISK